MIIDNVTVITTKQRPDRLAVFVKRWEKTRLAIPLLVYAVDRPDAMQARILSLWKAHLQIIAGGSGTSLHVEDDAALPWDLGGRIARITEPYGWDIIVVGGTHLAAPAPASPGFTRPRALRGSHGYILRDSSRRAVAARLRYQGWGHFDSRLARLGEVRATDPLWLETDPAAGSDLGHGHLILERT